MRSVGCIRCGEAVSPEEMALNQRLLGMQIGGFRCLRCLGEKLDTSPERLRVLTARFKEMGCVYFTRLMEGSSDETEYDRL